MFKKIIRTIHYLRVYFLVFITVSFFYFIGLQPVDIGKFVGAKASRAVGMSVSIPENPFNHLALQLQEKDSRLTQKEKDLAAKEAAMDNSSGSSLQYKLIIGLAVGIVVLFILIILNFYFDYRRRRQSGLASGLKS